MTERNSHEDLSITDMHSRNRYWFIVLPVLFLGITLIYLAFTPGKYNVSSKIAFTNNSLTIDAIKSKDLVQKTLNQLPFQVSYYHKGFFKRSEVYGDFLPLKLTFSKTNAVDSATEVTAKVMDGQSYEINYKDTITTFAFNEAVSYPFAKFTGVKGDPFPDDADPLIVRFNDPNKLLEEYYGNLAVKPLNGDDKSAEISILASTPEKGVDFLNKLIAISNAHTSNTSAPAPIAVAATDNKIGLQKIGNNIAALKARVKFFQSKEIELSAKELHRSSVQTTVKKPSTLQLKVLDAIQPYAKSSVNQFVQIPDSYQVEDKGLEKLIGQFNKTEMDKQRTLQDSQANRNKIIDLNKQIASLKISILQKIDDNRSGAKVPKALPATTSTLTSSKFHDSITNINAQLASQQKAYDALLNSRPVNNTAPVISKNRITVIEKPGDNISDYPNTALVYLFAVLAGLIIPLSFPYFKYLNFTVNKKINLEKIGTRIEELTRVKEID